MPAWWSADIATFLATDPDAIRDRLAYAAALCHRLNEAEQLRAWDGELALLRTALREACDIDLEAGAWRIMFEFGVERLGTRADIVIVTPDIVMVVEFKIGARHHHADAMRQVEDYALDLQDFHSLSRRHPIVPILVATASPPTAVCLPLLIHGASPVIAADALQLGPLLVRLARAAPRAKTRIDVALWESAPYAPVPGIVDAACTLFRAHGVADIATAKASATNLTATTAVIAGHLATAAAAGKKIAIFVTGIPGAGKTLCGLATAFEHEHFGTIAFLTGNPILVHVLREALVRDAIAQGSQRQAARQRMETVIQALPRFRDHYVGTGDVPAERVVVIDEAQRAWTQARAVARTATRAVQLTASEPAHLLDIMARHAGFSALVCLVGNGQEIHDGEGGLAEWGAALAARPEWRIAAGPPALSHPVSRSRLPMLPGVVVEPALHLSVDLRALAHDNAALWVDALLRGDAACARKLADAEGDIPFRLCRDLPTMRRLLRASCRLRHRAGLIASSGARRLRAEGLGAELPHMDADAVARWFLDDWPRDHDVRASDALEVVATEFSVQGLELDHVGLAWDADLIRLPDQAAWQVRRFRGTSWQITRNPDSIDHRLNTYRVLLSRARYRTLIWVPRGDPADPTRPQAVYDAIADFLSECGVPAADDRLSEIQPSNAGQPTGQATFFPA